jgi:hypothetical protein
MLLRFVGVGDMKITLQLLEAKECHRIGKSVLRKLGIG